MTRDDVADRIAAIRRKRHDPEVAHALEDDLFQSFARHVAEAGPPDLAEVARAALTVLDIDFPRWCA